MENRKRKFHPYTEWEGSPLWTKMDKAFNELVKNGNVVEKSPREYIVGYLCKKIGSRVRSHAEKSRRR